MASYPDRGPSQSDLGGWGYDVVIAVTEEALNDQIGEFVTRSTHPIVKLCWVYGSGKQPELSNYSDLPEDPFSIPNNPQDPNDLAKLEKLVAAGFMFAVQYQLKRWIKYGIQLLSFDNNQSVTLNPEFASFQLAAFVGSWRHYTQASDSPWTWAANANLTNLSNASSDDLTRFGPALAQRAAQLVQDGVTFTVESLVVGMTSSSAAYWNIFVKDAQNNQIPDDVNQYLGQLSPAIYDHLFDKSSRAVLSVIVPQPQSASGSALLPTSVKYMLNSYVDAYGNPITNPTPAQENCRTMNYICGTGNHQVPALRNLSWNWVLPPAPNEQQLVQGMIAIRRDDFRDWLVPRMKSSIEKGCFQLVVTGHDNDQIQWNVTSTGTPNYDNNWNSDDRRVMRAVFEYDWWPSNASPGDLGISQASSQYVCTVSLSKPDDPTTTFKIVQELYMTGVPTDTGVRVGLGHRIYNDIYTLSVASASSSSNGELQWTQYSESAIYDPDYTHIPFYQNYPDFLNQLKKCMAGWGNMELQLNGQGVSPPASTLSGLVFAGNQAFVYKDIKFSWAGDMLAELTYKA